jgi:hypothetical protein
LSISPWPFAIRPHFSAACQPVLPTCEALNSRRRHGDTKNISFS